MPKILENLYAQAEAQPVLTLAVAVGLVAASAKLMDARTARMYAKIHASEVARRVSMTR